MRKQWRWCHLTLYAEYAPYKLMRLTADQPAVILYIHVSGLYTIDELHNWSRPSIIRRPHIHVGGRRPKVLPRFFFCLLFMIFYLFSRPPATLEVRWTELSLNRPHAGKYKCDLKNVRNLGPKTTFFRRFRNCWTVTAYIFRTKHDIQNRASALETTGGLRHRLKMSWTSVHQRLKIGLHFTHPP